MLELTQDDLVQCAARLHNAPLLHARKVSSGTPNLWAMVAMASVWSQAGRRVLSRTPAAAYFTAKFSVRASCERARHTDHR